ncbi:MAG: pyrimidine-nucleoside phosphorylase [Ruminococcaceae bacterium]|nr:pyrimidine-nucleoside phosphorylase [Oscillospiraceae bacterium]
MRVYDMIKKKRDGGSLTREEIAFLISGYCKGEIPDYQMSALCMAIYFRGMSAEETAYLTMEIRDSGEILDAEGIEGIRVDKHSTGGVGDKTSLIVSPIVASLGLTVAKMSGRGLGHTGGTVDKLEAIPGFRTEMTREEFVLAVRQAGLAIVGQSGELAPADKLLYALRDVTATVDSMPLIASSIMGKKLAANDDCIVLDVKTGSGAFMKSLDDSIALGTLMVDIAKRAGKRAVALVTDMDAPLGSAIGNALEVQEAVEVLRGGGAEDLRELCVSLASQMLFLAQGEAISVCEERVRESLSSGAAFKAFLAMVRAQGGDVSFVENPEKLCQAPYRHTVCAPTDGYITRVNTEDYGLASLLLGAGRNKKEDRIDPWAGIRLHAKTGDSVRRGDPIATLYASDDALFAHAAEVLLAATQIGEQPQRRPLIYRVIG